MTDTIRDLLISLAGHMAYMQSQLEARHELDDPEDYYWYRESVLLRQKVTDVLADEPAVPEGREPAAVTSEPSDEEWDALVERAWDKYQTVGYQGERFMYDGDFGSALDLVRKELARWGNLKVSLTSSPPADGEVVEPTREELWELWLRLNNELPDRPAAVAEFWEHARVHTLALIRPTPCRCRR